MTDKKEKPTPCLFSIIIPVLHEAQTINTLLKHIHQTQTNETYEIIVVDGSTKKDTIQTIEDPTVIALATSKGRAKQMNAGADRAKGDVLVFLHADTFLPENALIKIRETLKQKKYVGGAFTLDVDSNKPLLKVIATLSTVRSQLTRIPYGDQVIFLRKTYFEKLGGYPDLPLMEDLELMLRIKKSKGKIRILPNRVVTSARRWEHNGAFSTTLVNIFILALYRIGVPADKLTKWHRYPED